MKQTEHSLKISNKSNEILLSFLYASHYTPYIFLVFYSALLVALLASKLLKNKYPNRVLWILFVSRQYSGLTSGSAQIVLEGTICVTGASDQVHFQDKHLFYYLSISIINHFKEISVEEIVERLGHMLVMHPLPHGTRKRPLGQLSMVLEAPKDQQVGPDGSQHRKALKAPCTQVLMFNH